MAPISKAPFLNYTVNLLLTHTPSGNTNNPVLYFLLKVLSFINFLTFSQSFLSLRSKNRGPND